MTVKRGMRLTTRETIVFWLGVIICVAEFIHAEVLGGTFHYEFLVLGAAFCGISLAQGADRRGREEE